MNATLARVAAIALLALAFPAGAADIVGRVLLSVGNTAAVRDGKVVPLTLGSGVEDKDVLRTGPGASLQVRFIDDSYTSLRESSELRIDQFRFPGTADGTERALFTLLKGGLRTITGLVGRANNKNYQLGSNTSTIGIRGTHFIVRLCQDDCPIAGTPRTEDEGAKAVAAAPGDESMAPNGMYGLNLGFTPGQGPNQLVVSTNKDEKVLGVNEPWYVASINDVVQRVVAPFGLLSYQLPKGRPTAKPGGSGNEQTTAGGASQDSRAAVEPPPPPLPLAFVKTEDRGPNGNPVVVGPDILSSAVSDGWAVAYLFGPNSHVAEFADNRPGTFNSTNQLTAFGVPGTSPSGALGAGTITDTGVINFADGTVFTFGRWTGPFTVMPTTAAGLAPASGVLFGTANTSSIPLPTSGQATYAYRGGPMAYDFAGNAGTVSGGTALIDFLARSMSLSGFAVNFPSVSSFGPASFSMSGSGSLTSAFGAGDFSGSLSGSCSGAGCASSSAFGFFNAGLTGRATGIDALAVIGGFNGTKAGEAVFLAGYEKTGFTAGAAPATAQALAVSYSDSTANFATISTLSQPGQTMIFSGNTLTGFGDGVNVPSGRLNTGTLVDVDANFLPGKTATDAAGAGNLHWGRWTGNSNVVGGVSPTSVNDPKGGVHYAFGDHTNALPTSGSFAYSVIGGPRPMSSNGLDSGNITGGAFLVSYGSLSGSFTIASPLTVAMSSGAVHSLTTCTANCTFGTTSPHINGASLSGSCNGGICSVMNPISGVLSGHFTGPTGEGLVIGGTISGPGAPISYAAGMKRCPSASPC